MLSGSAVGISITSGGTGKISAGKPSTTGTGIAIMIAIMITINTEVGLPWGPRDARHSPQFRRHKRCPAPIYLYYLIQTSWFFRKPCFHTQNLYRRLLGPTRVLLGVGTFKGT